MLVGGFLFGNSRWTVLNLAERFINRMKQNRRVATRYEKTARNFLGFIHVAAIMILLL